MFHIVRLIERRFPRQHRAIVAALVLLSGGALALGIATVLRA